MISMMAGHMSLMRMTLAFGMGFWSPWVWFGAGEGERFILMLVFIL